MQTQGHNNGVLINSKFITTTVGVITILASIYYFFDRINSYETRLSRVEYIETLRSNQTDALTDELKVLNSKLTELTIELRELKAVTGVTSGTGKK